jgi:uncharacterized protein YndB with AHSA1/START domain
MYEIQHLLVINAEPETVFSAITEQEHLSNWLTFETYAIPQIDSIVEFHFGSSYHNKMRIVRLEKNKLVEWECIRGHEEWIDTTFIFELEADQKVTKLRFKHCGWREKSDMFASCNYHWGFYLHSLKHYCETGEGTPFTGKLHIE